MRHFKNKEQFDRWWARLQAFEAQPYYKMGNKRIMAKPSGNPTRDPSRNKPSVRFASLPIELRPNAEKHLRTLLTRHMHKLKAKYEKSPQAGNFYWGKLIGCATVMAKTEAGLLTPFRLLGWKTRPAKARRRYLRVNLGLEEPRYIPKGLYHALKQRGWGFNKIYHMYMKGELNDMILNLQHHETHGVPPPAIVSSTNLEGI